MLKKKLKLAYFIDRLIHGGTELQLVSQISQLHQRGIDQELYCLYESTEHQSIKVPCRVNILDIRKLLSMECIRKVYKLSSELKAKEFNIAQTYFFDSTIVGVLAARIAGGLKTISCRRDLGFWYTPDLLQSLRVVNKMTDRILVNSLAVKENVMRKEHLLSSQVDVIPNGICVRDFIYNEKKKRENRFKWGIKDDEVCIGILANMSRKVKRLDFFLKVAQNVLKRTQRVKFIILGDGELKDELIRMAHQLRIYEKVIFLGRNISKHNVLSAMDIGVLTSDSEALSNSIMEYMATGLPVVATAVGGNGELIGDSSTGFLVNAGDIYGFSNILFELIENSEKRIQIGFNARERIKNNDWKKIVEEIIIYYERIFY